MSAATHHSFLPQPAKAQPPGSTGKDWPDGGMPEWVRTKQERGLVNKTPEGRKAASWHGNR